MKSENILALSSLVVAFSSLALSYMSFKKNSGTLSFSIVIGNTQSGETLDILSKGFYLKIISSGHRPVMINSIGGDYSSAFKRYLTSFFPRLFSIRAFVLNGKNLAPIIFSDSYCSSFRVLNEGEVFYHFFDFSSHYDLALEIAKAKNFYIIDSLEVRHMVPKRAFNKFKRDLKAVNHS